MSPASASAPASSSSSSSSLSPTLSPHPVLPRLHTRRRPSPSLTASGPAHTLLGRGSSVVRSALSAYLALPLLQRILVAVLVLSVSTTSVLLLVFSHDVFGFLAPISARWRELPGGWILVWLLVFTTAFPPLVGYSFANSLAGFVFGFPHGWPIAASASVAGSLAAFSVSRTVASAYVHRLVGRDPRFLALGQVLRRDGLWMLTMIRFCPLPFSLSNGFLATIPSITPLSFAVSTALSSPKLLVHVFIGSRLALLAEHGSTMSGRHKAINYLSIVVGSAVGITVGFVIYRRTMARAAEIARQTTAASSSEGGMLTSLVAPDSPPQPSTPDYADIEAGLLDPDDVAAALWDAPGDAYRDGDVVFTSGPGGK